MGIKIFLNSSTTKYNINKIILPSKLAKKRFRIQALPKFLMTYSLMKMLSDVFQSLIIILHFESKLFFFSIYKKSK